MKPLPRKILQRSSLIHTCAILSITLSFLSASMRADDFQNGLKAYETGDYASAVQSFEKSARIDETAATRHNLALSAYKSGQPAEAVWQLERALHIEPFNKEYRFKLGVLRQQLGLSEGSPSRLQTAANTLHVRQWGWLATITLWSGLAALIFPSALKRKPGLGIKTARVLCLFLLAAAIPALEFHRRAAQDGIIISGQSVELRAAPADAAPQTGLARPGERIRILDSHGDFDKIQTEGEASGWIPNEVLRRIHLGDA